MSIFTALIGQEAAISEIKRAALAARAIVKEEENSAQGEKLSQDFSESRDCLKTVEIQDAAMSHAWLFTGPPGAGRSVLAQIFAAALLCSEEELGAGKCGECRAVLAHNHPDVESLRTDLVTISVESVRECVTKSYLAPTAGKWRVFIIEDADRMLPRTTNVLLKAIEEPAPRTVWILCTASPADVLPTIRSRCRNVNLVTPTLEEVAQLLEQEGVEKEKALLSAQIAQSHIGLARALATDPEAGKLRKQTLDLLIEVKSVGDAVLAAEMLLDAGKMQGRSLRKKDLDDALQQEKERQLDAWGLDENMKIPAAVRSQISNFTENEKRRQTRLQRDMLDRELLYMAGFFRDVLMRQLGADLALTNPDYEKYISQQAQLMQAEDTLRKIAAIQEARRRLLANVAPLLALEAALVEVAKR